MSYFPNGVEGRDLKVSTSELVSNSDASSATAVQDGRSNASSQSVQSPKSDYEIFKEKAEAQAQAQASSQEVNVNGEDAPEIDDAVNELPWAVRRVVSLHDDTTLPTITLFPRTKSRLMRSAGISNVCFPPVMLVSTRTPFLPST